MIWLLTKPEVKHIVIAFNIVLGLALRALRRLAPLIQLLAITRAVSFT
jgi:hypothetical protein